MTTLLDPQKLDDKGRCCGRKPIHYKRSHPPHNMTPYLWCCRCSAAFDPATGLQIDNWAYRSVGTEGKFVHRVQLFQETQS